MPVSDAKKKAMEKYLDKFDDIKIRVEKGKRDEYKKFAAQKGVSLNSLIIYLLEKEIEKSNTSEKENS